MKLTLTMFLSVDGVYQAPGERGEDRSDGFDQGGWQVPYVDDDMMQLIGEWFAAADAFLFGRKTYQIFAGYWPHVTDADNPIATQLNSRRKYVASRTLQKADWQSSTLIKGDVATEVARLKGEPGREIQVHGSGHLTQTLMKHNLIDEYRLCIHPVVLAHGKRLFDEGSARAALGLVDSKTMSSGVVINVYRPAGKPAYGDFGLEELGQRTREQFSQGIIDLATETRRRQR